EPPAPPAPTVVATPYAAAGLPPAPAAPPAPPALDAPPAPPALDAPPTPPAPPAPPRLVTPPPSPAPPAPLGPPDPVSAMPYAATPPLVALTPLVATLPPSTMTARPHAAGPIAAAVRPSSTAAAVRGRLPSVRRSGAPQLGHSASELFAWQPQVGQGIKVGAMTSIIRAGRPARQALSRAASRYPRSALEPLSAPRPDRA